MNEKRVLVAAMLSAVFLAWYSQAMTRSIKKHSVQAARPITGSSEPQPAEAAQNSLYPHLLEDEQVIILSSPNLELEIGRTNGAIRKARLKGFKQSEGPGLLQFGDGKIPVIALKVNQVPIVLDEIELGQVAGEIKGITQDRNYHIHYTLDQHNPFINIEISSARPTKTDEETIPAVFMALEKADNLNGRYNILEAIALSTTSGKKGYRRYRGSWKATRNVPRGTTLLSLSERYFCLSLKPTDELADGAILPSDEHGLMAEARIRGRSSGAGTSYSVGIYLGPRDFFYLKNAGFESAFPVGALGQIGLILLLLLKGIVSVTKNYGLGIIALSGLVTCATAPFSLMSMRSMKKMQELKPKVDKIMAQHKGDPAKAQREVFALYREHRASPLGGCLPMFLQFPIFIALFQAISHFVGLRGQSFLWIADLSLPDRLARLPLALPIVGNDLNALPIIMAVAMFAQTTLSQRAMPRDPNSPAASAMMSAPVMSVLFGVMFYNFPSGLVLYWLTNSLTSVLFYRLAS